ncbi:MAG: hypothetical protein JWR63_3934, partial [Conexibacter sp.]|nr:hypothetical protein [Conexibacter sp.]
VILAARDLAKARAAADAIRRHVPAADIETLELDLASLGSIAAAAGVVATAGRPLDLLINNAGVMAVPERQTTQDGFELTFGTNHLGHFALTGRLLPTLMAAADARVVTVSAKVARRRGITFDDVAAEGDYRPMRAYATSKLANVVFAVELARRTDGTTLRSMAVHPGTSLTGLQRHGSRVTRAIAAVALERVLGQSTVDAARPSLLAATSPEVASGSFIAPTGRMELRGTPGVVPLPRDAEDRARGTSLWDLSERLTGVRYPSAPLGRSGVTA